MAKDDHPSPDKWTKEQADEVMKRLGLEGVLNELPSKMSKYYVTDTFTEYGDPLALQTPM